MTQTLKEATRQAEDAYNRAVVSGKESELVPAMLRLMECYSLKITALGYGAAPGKESTQ